MDNISIKAYGKINLGLDVLRRREDGYHEVKMIMQTVDIYDTLHMKKIDEDMIKLEVNVPNLEADESNLVYKAIKLIKDNYGVTGGVEAYLEKNIPIAAGMAGGSADCAAALKGMNELFELGISIEELCALGKKLGADVPFCVVGGTMFAEGIGEILTPLNPVKGDYLVIAKPSIDVPTKYVYENLNVNEGKRIHPDVDTQLEAIKVGDNDLMYKHMGNILESVTVQKYGVIDEIKQELIGLGAKAAMMSGSGPTVFAIFSDKDVAMNAKENIRDKYELDTLEVTTYKN